MLDHSAWLILKDIRPSQNRYRFYSILIEVAHLANPVFVVTMAWGRVDADKRKKTVVCSSNQELFKLLKSVLRTRYRHDYKLAEKSVHFPKMPILQSFPILVEDNLQLSLF